MMFVLLFGLLWTLSCQLQVLGKGYDLGLSDDDDDEDEYDEDAIFGRPDQEIKSTVIHTSLQMPISFAIVVDTLFFIVVFLFPAR